VQACGSQRDVRYSQSGDTVVPQDDNFRLPEGFFDRPLTGRELADFADCPHKFLLSHFVDRQQTRRFLGGPAALHHALRGAIVQFYREAATADEAESKLLASFEELWEGELCADTMEEQNLHRQGRQILTDFAASWVADNPTARHADLSLSGEIEGVKFAAVADLVFPAEADGGPLRIVRLNSSRRPPTEPELAHDISAGLLLLLCEQHFSPEPVWVGYYCLRPGKLRQVEIAPEQVDYVRRDLRSRAGRMRREKDFPPRKGKYCRWCRARSRCEIWKR